MRAVIQRVSEAAVSIDGLERGRIRTGLLVLLGIATAVLQATRRSPALPVAADVIASTVGLIAVIALALRVLFPPGDGGRSWGLAAGFVSCLAVCAGAWLALRDE